MESTFCSVRETAFQQSLPDVIQMDYRYIFEYARRNQLAALDEFIGNGLDLADFDASGWNHLTGASGHTFHPNYIDQTEAWQRAELTPWAFTSDAVDAATVDAVTSRPESAYTPTAMQPSLTIVRRIGTAKRHSKRRDT